MSLLASDKYYRNKKVFDMFAVHQLDCPDMTVHVNGGTIIHQNQIINFSEQDSEIITAPKIGTWIVVLSINASGELVYTYGVQSTEDKYIPRLPEDCFHLCMIELGASDKYITNDMIHDLRCASTFMFSMNDTVSCKCKCALEEDGFTSEDREQMKQFYDKYEELSLAIDQLKLLHEPQKMYRVLSDNGSTYEIRFRDDGTPYFTKYNIDDDIYNPDTRPRHQDYKFVYGEKNVNIVTEHGDDFVQVGVKIKSFDSINDNVNCTLFVRCQNTTIYSENYKPQYRENEFVIENFCLTKTGFFEQFAFKFHNQGNHVLSLLLYNNDTHKLMDSAKIGYHVEFQNEPVE